MFYLKLISNDNQITVNTNIVTRQVTFITQLLKTWQYRV